MFLLLQLLIANSRVISHRLRMTHIASVMLLAIKSVFGARVLEDMLAWLWMNAI